MKRAVLKFTRPQDIMCEACSDIENFYNSQSRTVQEMKERRRAAADTLSMLFGQEAYETQIYQPWVTFFTDTLYYCRSEDNCRWEAAENCYPSLR